MGACDRVCVEYECVDQDGSGDLEWWLVVIEDCVLGVAEGEEGVGGSGSAKKEKQGVTGEGLETLRLGLSHSRGFAARCHPAGR